MKKLILAGWMLLGWTTWGSADGLTTKELFKVTEGRVLDFAIASSFEPGYFRDMINGRNAVGAQIPIVYLFKYISGDFGYIAGYETEQRGSLMVGGSLRINALIEDSFPDQVALIKSFLPNPGDIWSKLWFGPWLAHKFTEEEFSAGIKGGLAFD